MRTFQRQTSGGRLPAVLEADSADSIRRRVLEALFEHGEGDAALFYQVTRVPDGEALTGVQWHAPGGAGENMATALDAASRRPDLLKATLDIETPPALQRSAFVEDQAIHPRPFFEQSPGYNGYYRPARLEYHQRLLAYHGRSFLGWVGLLRLRGTQPFTRGDRRRLRPLVEPVIAALTQAHQLERSALPDEPADFVLLPDGSVDYASESGRARLASPGFSEKLRAWGRGLDGDKPLAAAAFGLAAPKVVRLEGENGRVRYLVHVAPAEPAQLSPLAVLSTTQRRVAERAAQGLTLEEIAQALGARPETVRAHLKVVYRKLQVRSRLELARLFDRPPS